MGYKEEIENRKIILFGAGNFARKFYRDFSHELELSYCVTNRSTEKEMLIDDKSVLPVYRPAEKLPDVDGLVVICMYDYLPVVEQLSDMGLIYGDDYIDSETFRKLVSGKKLALGFGVCYMRPLCEALSESIDFSKEYEIIYFLSYWKLGAVQKEQLMFLLPKCDLYIYINYLSAQEKIRSDAYLKRVSPDCIKIRIPLVHAGMIYPQAGDRPDGENEYSVVSAETAFGTFLDADRNINALLDRGRSPGEIIKIISDPEYYSACEIKKHFEEALELFEISDRIADVHLTDYIREHIHKERLFLNATHIGNPLVTEMAKQVLRLLDFSAILPEQELYERRMLYTTEVPPYPCVVKALDLKAYEGDEVTYDLFTFHGRRQVSFEEYVRFYCDFCGNMKRYKELGFFPGAVQNAVHTPNKKDFHTDFFTWKFKHFPERIEMVVLGSTQAHFAFEFSETGVAGANMALALTGPVPDLMLLEKHKDSIKTGATVLVTTAFPVFACGTLISNDVPEVKVQYAELLYGMDWGMSDEEQEKWREHPERELTESLFESLIRSAKYNASENHLSSEEIDAVIGNLLKNGWGKKTGLDIAVFREEKLKEEHKRNIEESMAAFGRIIEMCHENGWKPVLVGLPYSRQLNASIPQAFKEVCFYQVIERMKKEYEFLFLDYSEDERFLDINNYMDIWFLNDIGRRKFTECVLNDLGYRK